MLSRVLFQSRACSTELVANNLIPIQKDFFSLRSMNDVFKHTQCFVSASSVALLSQELKKEDTGSVKI